MKPIKTYLTGLSAALILGSTTLAGSALAAEDVVVISNEPIPYRYDRHFAAQPMAGIDLVYPSTGGPALVMNPELMRRESDGRWQHRPDVR